MQMSSNEAIKQAVMAGMGVALLSLHTLGLELDHGLIAVPEVEGLPVMRRWHVVNNLAKTLSPAAEAFRYFMLERGEAFLARAVRAARRRAHRQRDRRRVTNSRASRCKVFRQRRCSIEVDCVRRADGSKF